MLDNTNNRLPTPSSTLICHPILYWLNHDFLVEYFEHQIDINRDV